MFPEGTNKSLTVDSDFARGTEDTGTNSSTVEPIIGDGDSAAPGKPSMNRLQVFQASPLAYFHPRSAEAVPVGQLDLRSERNAIRRLLEDANGDFVSVDFDIATPERLGAFLANGQSSVLHISCHAHREYLAVEEEWGTMHFLLIDRLREWLACSTHRLELVFVSSCNSSPIAQLFVQAGIPNVICCENDDLNSVAATKFTKAFYQALVGGNTVQKAYDLAQIELDVYPCFVSQRFCLWPEALDHNTHIFDPTQPRDALPARVEQISAFPPPQHHFIRSDLEVYRLLQSLKASRLVTVTGPKGIGKTSLVQEACRYLETRLPLVGLEDILWQSPDSFSRVSTPETTEPSQWLGEILESIRLGEPMEPHTLAQLYTHLEKRHTLLVLEAKTFSDSSMQELQNFLKEFMVKTTYVKVVVIHNPSITISSLGSRCVIAQVQVSKLNLQSTVKLFASCCQHVASRKFPAVGSETELWNLLSPDDHETPMSPRHETIYKLLGGGNPARIRCVAAEMTETLYTHVVFLGLCKELESIRSRVNLLETELDTKHSICCAERDQNLEETRYFHQQNGAIQLLKSEFPDLIVRKKNLDKVHDQLMEAAKAKKTWSVTLIRKTEEDLKHQIKQEEQSLFEWLGREIDNRLGCTDIDLNQNDDSSGTRIFLQGVIEGLQAERDICASQRRYYKAECIDSILALLEELQTLRPSKEDLEHTSATLHQDLRVATSNHDWTTAEIVHSELEQVSLRLSLENAAADARDEAFDNSFKRHTSDTDTSTGTASTDSTALDNSQRSLFGRFRFDWHIET